MEENGRVTDSTKIQIIPLAAKKNLQLSDYF